MFLGRVSLELVPWVTFGARRPRGGVREPSSWEAAVGMPRPALSSQAPCRLPVWARRAPPGPPADLDHSACPWSLELLRRWEVRGRSHDSRQPVGLWEWACVSGNAALLCPLVFSVPKPLFVWLALSPCFQVDGLSVCVSLGLGCMCGFLAVSLSPLSLSLSSLRICALQLALDSFWGKLSPAFVSFSRLGEPPCP